jgi:hypothetical protein
MEAPIETKAGLRVGKPSKLFTLAQSPTAQRVAPGLALGPSGQTFIMVRPVERPPGIVVVQNWLALAGS